MNPGLTHEPLVVGIDEGGRSDEALRAAFDLSSRLDVDVHAVHALPLPFEALVSQEDALLSSAAHEEAMAEHAEQVREHLLGRLREIATSMRWKRGELDERLRLEPGPPAKVLIDAARELHASTIFLGPHRRHGMLDFGSTARAVLARADGSVWMQPVPHQPIRRVLVPVDLSPDSMNALRVTCSFARVYDARVTVLHCFVTPELGYDPGAAYPVPGPTYVLDEARAGAHEKFDETMQAFDWGGLEHDWRFLEGRPASSVLDLQDEHDLIALGSHGRTGLASALLGNVAYAILKDARKPVLAIRHPERQFLLAP
jgi:nucleotide-binding universal stress UspA family protein